MSEGLTDKEVWESYGFPVSYELHKATERMPWAEIERRYGKETAAKLRRCNPTYATEGRGADG